MRKRAIILATLVVLSTLVAGTGGSVAASDASGPEDVRTPAFERENAVNNSTDGKYRRIEPSQDATDKPVKLGTVPDGLSENGSAEASSSGSESSSIVMDPSDEDHELVGTTKQYLGSDVDGYYFKGFTLLALGDNVEVWVANDLAWPAGDSRANPTITESQAESLATQFDENMYPAESEVFGTPDARNGSDALLSKLGLVPEDYYQTGNSSNRTVLLVDNVRDENYYDEDYPLYIAGFFSPTIQDYTDRNAITVDAYDWNEVNETNSRVGYEGTLAHEYQHLIHNDLDGDETSWVNEGMSDYAEIVTGYGVSEGHVSAYEQLPSNSLINWEDQGAVNVLSDYGIAFAFQMYLDDQYGTEFVSNLANEEANGIEGVEATLAETGAKTDFYGLYQDFSTAAVTDDVSHPPKDEYHVDGLELEVNTSDDVGTAGAWGTNYEEIDTAEKGPITDVSVSGTDFTDTQWSATTDPLDGEGQVLHSGSGNLLDRSAIVEANLSGVENPTLSFESYQRIEQNWDYGFVQVSTDGGETWESLANENTDDTPNPNAHPTVKENVPGFTGATDGWTEQSFDLSAYEGASDVLVRFRYVTDWASVQPGWWVQNVSVAGESVPTDSTDSVTSLREATDDPVEYQFTFIGIKQNGNYQVKQLDMRTFDDEDEKSLKKFLRNGNFEKVVVASTWASQSNEGGRVPVGVEFSFRDDGNGNGNGQENGN